MYGLENLQHRGRESFGISFVENENWSYDWSDFCYQFQTKEELQKAVDLWVSDNATALDQYGEINTWDVSLIEDMSEDRNLTNDEMHNRIEIIIEAME